MSEGLFERAAEILRKKRKKKKDRLEEIMSHGETKDDGDRVQGEDLRVRPSEELMDEVKKVRKKKKHTSYK